MEEKKVEVGKRGNDLTSRRSVAGDRRSGAICLSPIYVVESLPFYSPGYTVPP